MLSAKRFVTVLVVFVAASLAGCGTRENVSGGAGSGAGCTSQPAVQAFTQTKVLPTYPVGPASDFPEYVQTSGQQGHFRGLYPYTLQRDISFDRGEQSYPVYVLQNEYLRIEVMPTLGGRMFAMYDRSSGQDVLYRQVSIKPGLVALRGAWICGGIEWNFPRSHSVTTFDTVSCQILRHDDGSASIVVGDTERTWRMSWTVEMTLRPGRNRVDTRITCRNPTDLPHDGYWWTNASFPANDQTQIIFPFQKVTSPESFGAGTADWPMQNGKDMSWYREYPDNSGIFRAAGDEDFIAAYDHGRDVGLAQFADHNVMPGRKWWTWGNNDAGLRWADILSDDKRPYVEVQSGCPPTQSQQFVMQPHQERQFQEYWMPVTRIGPPARVNPEAIVRLTVDKGAATVGVLPTAKLDSARIELSAGDKLIKQWQCDISPAKVFKETCDLAGADTDKLWLRVFDSTGKEVIAHNYGHYADGQPLDIRDGRPEKSSSASGGQKLQPAIEQLNQGLFEAAAQSLTTLLASNDKDAPADAIHYYLGMALAGSGQSDKAMEHLNAVPAPSLLYDAALVEGAKLWLARQQWEAAIDRLAPMVGRAVPSAEAEGYTAFALRLMKQPQQAKATLAKALEHDPLLLTGAVESVMLNGGKFEDQPALRDVERRIEAASIYMALRQYQTADQLLTAPPKTAPSPMATYLRAYVAELAGKTAQAASMRKAASAASLRGCLPNRLEELAALQSAVKANDKDSSAHYLLGLVLYGRDRKSEAIAQWQQAAALGHDDAIVYHCLASVVVESNPAEAVRLYEMAQSRAQPASEIYLGLDNAYMLTGNVAKRVGSLQQGLAKLPRNEELAHRLGLAYFDAGQYDQAVKCYQSHRFHVAEGQRDLHDHYAMALVGRAMSQLSAGRAKEALADLDAAMEYPENLGIGKGDRSNLTATVQFWRGVVLGQLNRPDDVAKAWQASGGQTRLGQRRGFRGVEAGLDAVHQVAIFRRQGQDDKADELSRKIQEACDHQEGFEQGDKGNIRLIRGFLAGINGQADQAAGLLDQAKASPRVAGYVPLVRTWLASQK